MNKEHYIYILTLLAFMAFTMPGCSNEDGLHEDKTHHALIDKIREAEKDSIHYEVSTEEFMTSMKRVMAEVPESEKQFYVLERQSMIQSYPCTNCHNTSLGELQSADTATKKAHWDIELIHAGEGTMDCATCHDTNDLNKLKSVTGKMITFDHSYKQCAQCHSQQYKDWLGGAHGKRVAGWAPPRLIYSCANCHNPHDPSIKSRWPARLNTEKLKELNGE